MKNPLLAFVFLISLTATAQTAQLEKSVTGFQVGLFGADLYHELRLGNAVALRSEVSLFPAVWGGDLYSHPGFALYPAVALQPKFYYSLARRVRKGRNVAHNGANYLSLQLRYVPDSFVISDSNVNFANQVNIIPTFGIRRNFATHFNYEFKAGIGYGTTVGYDRNSSGSVLDLGIKIGFDF